MHRSIRGRSGCDTEPSLSASGVNAVGSVCVGRNRVAISAAEGASRLALKSPQTMDAATSSRVSIQASSCWTWNRRNEFVAARHEEVRHVNIERRAVDQNPRDQRHDVSRLVIEIAGLDDREAGEQSLALDL